MSGLEALPALFASAASALTPSVSTLSAAGSALSAAGTVLGAVQGQSAAKAEAREMERRANEEQAASQRDAAAKRREGELLMSRQRAASAASGGSSDPSLIAMMGDTDAEAEYNAQTSLYRGVSAAENLRVRAANRRAEAGAMLPSALIRTGSSLLSDYGRMRERRMGA